MKPKHPIYFLNKKRVIIMAADLVVLEKITLFLEFKTKDIETRLV